jgi:hypothetical protein
MHWSEASGLRLVSNRITAGPRGAPPNPSLTYVNSAAVTADSSSVYFTASSDVPPTQLPGKYSTMRAAELTGFLVCLQHCADFASVTRIM